MIRLEKWRKKCKDAKERGGFFTKIDKEEKSNPYTCAVGELAALTNNRYTELSNDFLRRLPSTNLRSLSILDNAELLFMRAVFEDNPDIALEAIKIIEEIYDRYG